MARHEKHERKADGEFEKRKHGGAMEHEKKAEEERKRGGHVARKRGGHVPGHKASERPDRRTRGGANADSNPFTAANKMSAMPYEKARTDPEPNPGKGPDRD